MLCQCKQKLDFDSKLSTFPLQHWQYSVAAPIDDHLLPSITFVFHKQRNLVQAPTRKYEVWSSMALPVGFGICFLLFKLL